MVTQPRLHAPCFGSTLFVRFYQQYYRYIVLFPIIFNSTLEVSILASNLSFWMHFWSVFLLVYSKLLMPDLTLTGLQRLQHLLSRPQDYSNLINGNIYNVNNARDQGKRGRRSGLRVKLREIHERNAIETISSHQRFHHKFAFSRISTINHNNLISVPIQHDHVLPQKNQKSISLAIINILAL